MSKPIGNGVKVGHQGYSSAAKGAPAAKNNEGQKNSQQAHAGNEKKTDDKVNISGEAAKEAASKENRYQVPGWMKSGDDKKDSGKTDGEIDKIKSGNDKVYEKYKEAGEGAPESRKNQLDSMISRYKDQQSKAIEKHEKENEKTGKSGEVKKTGDNNVQGQEVSSEAEGPGKGKGKGKGNGGVPPGLAKKGGVPPGQAKKADGDDNDDDKEGKKVPPGQLKKELGLKDASEIAKNQDEAVREIDKIKTEDADKTENLKTDDKTTAEKTDTADTLKDPVKTETAKEKTDPPSTTDQIDKSPDTIKAEADQEAKAQANTPEAQAEIAVEKEAVAHTKIEVKQDIETVSTKAGGDIPKVEIDHLKDRLEDLEAYEAGEDTVRMLKGNTSAGSDIKASDLKKNMQEKLVNPNKGVNWDDTLKNDCNAVMMEITQGRPMGVTNKASIPPIGLSVIGDNRENQMQGPNNYHQAIPGGALGKLIKSYQEAASLGGSVSQQTKDLIQSTLKIAGLGDISALQTELPGRPLNSFYFG